MEFDNISGGRVDIAINSVVQSSSNKVKYQFTLEKVKSYNGLLGRFLCALGYASKVTNGENQSVFVNTKSLFKKIIQSDQSSLSLQELQEKVNRIIKAKEIYRLDDKILKAINNENIAAVYFAVVSAGVKK